MEEKEISTAEKFAVLFELMSTADQIAVVQFVAINSEYESVRKKAAELLESMTAG